MTDKTKYVIDYADIENEFVRLYDATHLARQYILLQVFAGRDRKLSPKLAEKAQHDLDTIDNALDAADSVMLVIAENRP